MIVDECFWAYVWGIPGSRRGYIGVAPATWGSEGDLAPSCSLDGGNGWPCSLNNTGDLYYGHRFELLAVLEANFCPVTLSTVFATLLSLVHGKQGKECINEFQARYEGHLHYISWSTVSIPPILQGCAFLVGNPPC